MGMSSSSNQTKALGLHWTFLGTFAWVLILVSAQHQHQPEDLDSIFQLEFPPNIDDSMSSSDVIVRENSNVSLTCHATGSPEPTVKWQREDKLDMKINKSISVRELEGDSLELTRISRLDMGAYMCIAANGVPPAVSKRIKVSVDFPPMLWIPHQLVGAPFGYSVTLECSTEAHPASLNYWTREDGHMIHDSRKYRTENLVGTPPYKTHMKLTVFDIQDKDFGTYKCVAKNPRGETDGAIKLYASSPPTTTTLPTTTTRPVHKIHKERDRTDPKNRNPSSLAIGFSEGSGYQSSLNTVNKSEQKSPENGNPYGDWAGASLPSSGGKLVVCGGRGRFHDGILVLAAWVILIEIRHNFLV